MRQRAMSWPASEDTQALIFSPLAWLKLLFFTHQGDTEIGGFGITAAGNPLYVEDFLTVRQQVTSVSVHFEDQAVADHFDRCLDRGLALEQVGRVWIHTHPCESPEPSGTDERTFARVFGRCDWSLMFILGRTGLTYARLSFSAGPGGSVLLPVSVDWSRWPARLAEHPGELERLTAEWPLEYAANIHEAPIPTAVARPVQPAPEMLSDPWWDMLPWDPDLDGFHYNLAQEVYDDILFR